MFELKPIVPKPDRTAQEAPKSSGAAEPKQRRTMGIALALLVVALGIVLYRDRDFWFPDAEDAMEVDAPASQTLTSATPAAPSGISKATPPTVVSKHGRGGVPTSQPVLSAVSDEPAAAVQRTLLPPLEVEVVAGDAHRTIRPGSNSVRVDLQPESPQPTTSATLAATPAEAIADPRRGSASGEDGAKLANASERVQISADASEIVSRPVRPGYPMLARQTRVQGSVILQALISRDGAIQDLHVMSGPPILAEAACEAVKQWRFKPHYLGAEAVETQAKITVNFTISTN
jgi:TonB family protein